jgi:hypothetical protein
MTAMGMTSGNAEGERERAARGRTYDLTLFALGFLVGLGAYVVRTNHLLPTSADSVLMGIEFSAVPIWGIAYARMAMRARRLRRQPVLRAAINDEFYKSVRLRAARAGFKAVVAANGLMFVAGAFWPAFQKLPATFPAEVTIWVAVAAMAAATFFYDRV